MVIVTDCGPEVTLTVLGLMLRLSNFGGVVSVCAYKIPGATSQASNTNKQTRKTAVDGSPVLPLVLIISASPEPGFPLAGKDNSFSRNINKIRHESMEFDRGCRKKALLPWLARGIMDSNSECDEIGRASCRERV